MNDNIIASQQLMQQLGIRRLLVISGTHDWCWSQAQTLRAMLAGDWIWVGDSAPCNSQFIRPAAVKKWLGQEKLHGIFDALSGLNVEALMILAGMLRAGSWLLLLVPPWSVWPLLPDNDSLRWSGQALPVATPNFIRYFQQQLMHDADVVLWRQGDNLIIPDVRLYSAWQQRDGKPNPQQQVILEQLLVAKSGIWAVTAPRGRGKSALAGMLIAHWPGLCWVTGPAGAAIQVLRQWAGKQVFFHAPDELLQYCHKQDVSEVDWLLIDEAAALPGPLLQKLISYFPRILLTTTVQGYEGSAQGFLLKFCASLTDLHAFTLTDSVRQAPDDPLESLLNRILLWENKVSVPLSREPAKLVCCYQTDWITCPQRLAQFYRLLIDAHYRTSPLDLRRLMDAPGMHFAALMCGECVAGALWIVEEGGLDETLAQAIWAGYRRPRGNLVAQSLAAHAGFSRAPVLRSWRISRVAVIACLRLQGFARQMIAAWQHQAQQRGIDFLSVSFGYTPELMNFWQACGFELVHVGTHREASSGSYAAMAMLPISPSAQALCRAARLRLTRNWHWIRQQTGVCCVDIVCDEDAALHDDDWRELAGFAFALRSPEASFAALQRLAIQSTLPLVTLRQYLSAVDMSTSVLLSESGHQLPAEYSGRKALVRHWRNEVAQAMMALDTSRCLYWQQWAVLCSGPQQDGGHHADPPKLA